jgi:hypothetical protein
MQPPYLPVPGTQKTSTNLYEMHELGVGGGGLEGYQYMMMIKSKTFPYCPMGNAALDCQHPCGMFPSPIHPFGMSHLQNDT